jgi:uncharacterized protein YjiS (DUF1127 family)
MIEMNFFASLARRAEKRRAFQSLIQLDDHLLRDIGLQRSDLHQMMAGTRSPHVKGTRTHE